jgi:hypothetical protein
MQPRALADLGEEAESREAQSHKGWLQCRNDHHGTAEVKAWLRKIVLGY